MELHFIIQSFLIWDKNTLKYAKFRNTIPYIYQTNYNIKNSFSRKNGFEGQEKNDTENEHWAFTDYSNSIFLQAINCQNCGNYKYSEFTMNLKIQCECDE
jgi:hypothetical protein